MVYLRGIGTSVGDTASIESVVDAPEQLSALREQELTRFSASTRSPFEHLREAIEATLERTGLAPRDLESVVVTSGWFPIEPAPTAEFRWMPVDEEAWQFVLHELGWHDVRSWTVFGGGCGNLHLAIQTAANLVRAGESDRVLVCAYGGTPEGHTRLMPNNLGLIGDGAVSFVVQSRASQSDFEILGTKHHVATSLAKKRIETHMGDFVVANTQLAKRVAELRDSFPDELRPRWYIMDNVGRMSRDMACSQAGIPADRLLVPESSYRNGHVHCADNALNLSVAHTEGTIRNGDVVMMIGHGINTWGATIVRAMD